MNLKHLTDKTLLLDTKCLVEQERTLLTKVLWHIKEIDARKLYSDLGHTSLFTYCVHELGYSESSAQRRIVAARALGEMPKLAEKIETGELTLANIALVQSELKGESTEKKTEMMDKVTNKSNTEAKQIINPTKQTYAVAMDEETFRLWQEIKNLGIDLVSLSKTLSKKFGPSS